MKYIKKSFIIIMIAVSAFTIIMTFNGRTAIESVYENRKLARRPIYSWAGFWDGSYMADWEKYLSDHMMYRDDILSDYLWLQLNVKKQDIINDVVIADGVLLPDNQYTDLTGYDYDDMADKAAASIEMIQKHIESYGGEFLYIGIEEQRVALNHLYPSYAYSKGEHYFAIEEAFERSTHALGVNTLFMKDIFKDDAVRYYSKVDHHFNLTGAYLTYRSICDWVIGTGGQIPVATEDKVTIYELPNKYLGTYRRRFFTLSPVEEKLQAYQTEMAVPYTRYDNGELVDKPLIAIPQSPEENVFYSAYMGGDIGETIIKTNRESLPNILIVGDSFTNPVEAFAYLSFNEMRSLDFRHYKEMTLSEYTDMYQPDYVVIIRDSLNYLSQEGNGAPN